MPSIAPPFSPVHLSTRSHTDPLIGHCNTAQKVYPKSTGALSRSTTRAPDRVDTHRMRRLERQRSGEMAAPSLPTGRGWAERVGRLHILAGQTVAWAGNCTKCRALHSDGLHRTGKHRLGKTGCGGLERTVFYINLPNFLGRGASAWRRGRCRSGMHLHDVSQLGGIDPHVTIHLGVGALHTRHDEPSIHRDERACPDHRTEHQRRVEGFRCCLRGTAGAEGEGGTAAPRMQMERVSPMTSHEQSRRFSLARSRDCR